jgi:hypothetical protein
MTDLSPAAQAVLNDAYEVLPWMARTDSATIAAAALRAAVEIYSEEGNGEGPQWFLAIAAELENIQPLN